MSSKQGGKAKPLKQPKAEKKDYDECLIALIHTGSASLLHVSCPKCNQLFCLDCDMYIHESLHNCPGCESQRESRSYDAKA